MSDLLPLGLSPCHDNPSPETHSEIELVNKITALKELNVKRRVETEELKVRRCIWISCGNTHMYMCVFPTMTNPHIDIYAFVYTNA